MTRVRTRPASMFHVAHHASQLGEALQVVARRRDNVIVPPDAQRCVHGRCSNGRSDVDTGPPRGDDGGQRLQIFPSATRWAFLGCTRVGAT